MTKPIDNLRDPTGLSQLVAALGRPHLWALLAWYDIRQRYRRSVLGPFWVTLSTGVMIGTMGILWSFLFKNEVRSYLPFFATGSVIWTYYSTQINEACIGFIQFENTIKQVQFPMPVYLLRILVRNLIILAHNSVIIILVFLVLRIKISWHILFVLPGLLIGTIAMLGISMIVSIFCTRFRDMPMIVQNATMVLFYLTPIIWRPQILGEHHWIADWNPFAHLIEIVRAPLVDGTFPAASYLWSIIVAAVLVVLGALLQGRYRTRIAFWL